MGITTKGGKGKQSQAVTARNQHRERIGAIYDTVGTIVMYCSNTPPEGWLLCDGSEYEQTAFPALYAMIGASFGAATSGYFKVPSMGDKVPIGVGSLCGSLGATLARTSATGSSFTFIGFYFIIRAY